MATNIRARQIAGWLAIAVISLIPVFLWFKFGYDTEEFTDYGAITHNLGELFGLVGMTLFAITFVLSTRIKAVEDVFGGLDKAYITHAIVGGTALLLILAHPIFLVLKFVPGDFATAAGYLLPSSYWSVNFGIIALAGMAALIYITLFTKMKYHKWKFTHEFLGAMFIFAALHIFLVRGDASNDLIFQGYYWYAGAVTAIGTTAFTYSLLMKNRFMKNAIYKIESIRKVGKELFELTLIPEHKPLAYSSGQFVFLRFYNKNLSSEPHPFSIASKSNDPRMRIVIKQLGDFTKDIAHLKAGEKVAIEGPYGRFNRYTSRESDQIWIAAGIGITPFLGLAEEILEELPLKRNIDLYFIAKDENDFVGADMLSIVAEKAGKFNVTLWNSSKKGRIDAKAIASSERNMKSKDILICGPSSFKESIISGLVDRGASRSRIYEEAFDFR